MAQLQNVSVPITFPIFLAHLLENVWATLNSDFFSEQYYLKVLVTHETGCQKHRLFSKPLKY